MDYGSNHYILVYQYIINNTGLEEYYNKHSIPHYNLTVIQNDKYIYISYVKDVNNIDDNNSNDN